MKKIITSILALIFTLSMAGISFAADKAATENPASQKVAEKKANATKIKDKKAVKKAHHHKKAKRTRHVRR